MLQPAAPSLDLILCCSLRLFAKSSLLRLKSCSKYIPFTAQHLFYSIFNLFIFFCQCHRSNASLLHLPFPRPVPPSGQAGRQTHSSFAFYLSNLPLSVLPDGGQCGRSLVQQRECSPELTISPRLPECCRAPLCSVRGELTPMSEPNE